MRQQKIGDEAAEQAEAKLRMQAMQRHARMRMRMQARAQQESLWAERTLERSPGPTGTASAAATASAGSASAATATAAASCISFRVGNVIDRWLPDSKVQVKLQTLRWHNSIRNCSQTFEVHPQMVDRSVIPVQTEAKVKQMRETQDAGTAAEGSSDI